MGCNAKLNNGNNYPAAVIGIDKNADIAVLKINTNEELSPINIADSNNLRIGDKVLAIGNPYGIGISVSNGIISATGRDYGNPYLQLIQTDAAINPGNSGGALINENGNLIGINSKIFSRTGAYQGIGGLGPLYEKGIRVNDIIIGVNDGNGNWKNLIQSLRFATLGEDLKLEFFTTSNEFLTFEFTYEEN